MPGVKGQDKLKPAKGKQARITIEIDEKKGDVGEIAKAVAGADTVHKAEVAPRATLVLPTAKGLKSEALQEALGKVKGVDAKGSTVEKDGIYIKLSDKGGAKLADITEAVKGAGK